jgi:glycosyltransferase involved in cell wall biosynthesis
MPKVSVLLPVYNCEKYISETIQSLLNQTFEDFEILVIDDCSKDSTIEIVESFDDKRIQLFKKEKNTGYTNSLNYAISIAKGEYIARMDGDDICMPNRFEKQVEFLDANTNIILCGSAIQIIGQNTILRHPSSHDEIKVKLCFGNAFYHPSVMGRISVFKENAYYSQFEPAEDYNLWTRLVFKGELANLEEVLLLYRVHNEQISQQKKNIQEKNTYLSRLSMFEKLNTIVESNEINLGFGIVAPQSIDDCISIIKIYNLSKFRNRKLKIFNLMLFERAVNSYKIILIKQYITKHNFFKVKTLFFILKYLSLKDFYKMLNASNRRILKK